MALDLANYDKKARAAIRTFWATRLKAGKKQRAAGRRDLGARAAVTADKNMDGFIHLVVELVRANGLVIPKSMLAEPEIVVEFVEDEEAEELEKFIAEQQRLKELEAVEKKARRREISRKIAENEKKRQEKHSKQLSLFDRF